MFPSFKCFRSVWMYHKNTFLAMCGKILSNVECLYIIFHWCSSSKAQQIAHYLGKSLLEAMNGVWDEKDGGMAHWGSEER